MASAECKNFENIAWFGGSFSPPTNMHINVVIEIAKALSTKPGKSCVCIIPVSRAYDKASVRLPCVSPDERMALCLAFLEAVEEIWASNEGNPNIKFRLLDYEFVSPTAVTTIESLDILTKTLGCDPGKIYLAQGQDNVMNIFAGKWKRSLDLLNYKFIMFPRGQTTSQLDFRSQMDEALKIPLGKPLDETRRKEIIDNVVIIGADFNDNTSSSIVRHNIQNKKPFQELLHPRVFDVLMDLMEKRPEIYQSCDDTHTGGKARRARKSRRNSKRRKTRKSKKY